MAADRNAIHVVDKKSGTNTEYDMPDDSKGDIVLPANNVRGENVMKKYLYKVALFMMMFVVFKNKEASAKTVIEINQKEVTEIRAPKAWKNVLWQCSNKNVKITNRHGRVIAVKGIRKGRSKIIAVNKKNMKKKYFYVKINNVKEEKNQNKTKDINMTLTSVASYNNDLTVTVHIKNMGTQSVKIGADAKLYRWNEEKSEYYEMNNDQIVPAIVYMIEKNQEQDVQFRYSSSMIQTGHYRICVEWSGNETEEQQSENIGFDKTVILEFDV